jgi:hypothetical protein
MPQEQTLPGSTKPDLKHDNMEFSASTEGDDILDADSETLQEQEDEQISAEELDHLQGDEPEDMAAALVSAETDSEADEDNFLNETDTEDKLLEPDREQETER